MQKMNGWRLTAEISIVLVLAAVLIGGILTDTWRAKSIDREAVITGLKDKEETLDLALEFGFDPMIVQVTRQYAANAIKQHWCDCPTWRFIKTEKDLSYVLLSLIQTESRGNYKAINVPNGPSSGIGLTQLLVSTARQYDKDVDQESITNIPLHMRIATQYFVDLLQRFHGNYTLAVLSWNRGPATVDRVISFGQSPENGFANKVFTQAALRNARQ